ncbi:2OG-Fe(II) oxygenase family protein [Salinarimonas chemoclinalis]|uniref:2OG-Fe(II) oxygenase family protein n=1 Tax=Salinarimonas chemoclinalis TaxID=3241599 RepID=UPI00355629CE
MIAELPRTRIVDGALQIPEGPAFDILCDYGVFYLETPRDLDLAAGIRFAQAFYMERDGGPDDAFRGFRDRDYGCSMLGYSDTGADQSELLQIESWLWSELLPPEVAAMLRGFDAIGRSVVRGVMRRVGVDPADIDRITGGMDRDAALQYCIFNHYRSRVAQPHGLTPHKDSGFVTVLHSSEGGLETLRGDDWVRVDPQPGHLTVVLGHSLEILTEKLPRPVAASHHRVRATGPRASTRHERYSFGSYVGPRWDQDLLQYDDAGRLTVFQSFLAFQKAKAAEMNYEFHPKVEASHT